MNHIFCQITFCQTSKTIKKDGVIVVYKKNTILNFCLIVHYIRMNQSYKLHKSIQLEILTAII